MIRDLSKKILEGFISILPIYVLVLILYSLNFIPNIGYSIDNQMFLNFSLAALGLAFGIFLFTLGSEKGLSQVGIEIGSSITKKKSIVLIVIFAFILGLMITIAEPDLTVLGELLGDSINPWILKLMVGVGVGIFLVAGFLRIIFQKSIKIWLISFYLIIFMIAATFGKNGSTVFEIAFDSSGVTTGPVTVPFILSFGVGVASVRGGKDNETDSFGLSGLCSIGPILMVMILCMFLKDTNFINKVDANITFLDSLLHELKEVAIAILPMLVFFLIYQFIFIKMHLNKLIRILFGFIYSYIGLSLFLSCAKFGFLPLAFSLGGELYNLGTATLLIIGIIIGTLIVVAEPAVHVLNNQIEEISKGAISKTSIIIGLMIAVSSAIFLYIIRILYGNNFNIMYYYIPLYLIAFVLLFIVDDIYVAIAFDSGGVVSGAMASCFVLPFVIGITNASHSNGSGFGIIGLISIMPILTIQGLGLISKIKTRLQYKSAQKRIMDEFDNQVINLNLGE